MRREKVHVRWRPSLDQFAVGPSFGYVLRITGRSGRSIFSPGNAKNLGIVLTTFYFCTSAGRLANFHNWSVPRARVSVHVRTYICTYEYVWAQYFYPFYRAHFCPWARVHLYSIRIYIYIIHTCIPRARVDFKTDYRGGHAGTYAAK